MNVPSTDDPSQARDALPGHLALIAEMSRDFAESQDIDSTLARGLERIATTLDAEAASLFLLSQEGTELICRCCYGPVDITGLRIPADEGIVGRAVTRNAAEIVRDAREDPDFGAQVDERTGFVTRSVLCAPMSVRDTQLGAIELINKRGERLFNERDRHLLEALGTAAGLALLNARMAAAMVERERLRRELELAAAIQRSFLPETPPADYPVHGLNVAAREVSGDFYDILPLPDGRIWFNVGDVAGKGVNAALLMARTTSLFRYLAKTADDPGAVLEAINSELFETATHGYFVTMACGLYYPDSGEVRLANAGHEPALLHGSGESGSRWLPAQTPPLAILPELDEKAPLEAQQIDLRGGQLYLFSDGLTDTVMQSGEPLGEEGLSQLLLRQDSLPAAERIAVVMDAVRHQQPTPSDDLTLLVIEGKAT